MHGILPYKENITDGNGGGLVGGGRSRVGWVVLMV